MAKRIQSLPSDNSWRSIRQPGLKGVSIHAKKRFISLCLRSLLFFICFTILIIIVVFTINLYRKHSWSFTLISPVKHFEIQTNGVLTHSLLIPFLNLPKNIGIMNVDIFELQKRLESLAQIQEASVERRFPDTIKITLHEYMPIVKIVAMDELGKRQGLLVSKEGQVFRGFGYSPKKLKTLPYLTGIHLYKMGNSFKNIPNMAFVNDLLLCAKLESPQLFKYWQSVSLEYCQYGNNSLGAFIKVKTKNLGEIIFAPEKFEMQLERLNSIVSYASKEKLATIERIDLSLESQAVVKIFNSK